MYIRCFSSIIELHIQLVNLNFKYPQFFGLSNAILSYLNMLSNFLAFAGLSAILLTEVLATPTPETIVPIKGPVVPLNETQFYAKTGVQKRDSCNSGGTSFSASDMSSLINSLQSDGKTDYLGGESMLSYSYGSAIIYVYNDYLSQNTHVTHWEMGWGANYIENKCCSGATSW